MPFDYLLVEDVLAIHSDLIERFGGAQGVRDPGLLEAALFRPQTGYYKSLLDEAAALWESLSQNHPFIDGNKRVAFASTYVFLAINDVEITASDEVATREIMALYEAGEIEFSTLRAWLQKNTRSFI